MISNENTSRDWEINQIAGAREVVVYRMACDLCVKDHKIKICDKAEQSLMGP